MGILMNLTSRLQAETPLKVSEEKQPERASDAASTANVSETEAVTKVVKLDQVSGRTNVVKSSETPSHRRPAYDQYVPEKPEDTASFGHYRPVKDENGDTQIAFTKPAEETPQADDVDKPVNSERSADQSEPVDALDQDRNAAGKNKVQELKTKKKQLERDIKAAADARTASNLKRKLAQVEKALKAATQ